MSGKSATYYIHFLADHSHQMSSLIFSEKKILLLSAAVVISTLKVKKNTKWLQTQENQYLRFQPYVCEGASSSFNSGYILYCNMGCQ